MLRTIIHLSSYRFVARMDFVPSQKLLSVTKVGLLGILHNKFYQLQDFEKVNVNTLERKEPFFFKAFKNVDEEYILRHKETGEWFIRYR